MLKQKRVASCFPHQRSPNRTEVGVGEETLGGPGNRCGVQAINVNDIGVSNAIREHGFRELLKVCRRIAGLIAVLTDDPAVGPAKLIEGDEESSKAQNEVWAKILTIRDEDRDRKSTSDNEFR